jgi:hypothetical protein
MRLKSDFKIDFKELKNVPLSCIITIDFIDFKGAAMRQTQKSVTVRFPMGDYLNIAAEAELKNTTSVDIIRKSWKSYEENKNFLLKLAQLENRLLQKTFEICSATVGLTSLERSNAAKQVNNSLGKEVIKS